jgi:hypothetical protein
MKDTGEVMGSEENSSKKKSSKVMSEARKLIPPKVGRGRRTASEEKWIAWIVAAAESFPARRREEREEIPPVICLPCLDIKIEEKVAKVTQPSVSALSLPPKSAPVIQTTQKIMGVPVTPLKSSPPASAPIQPSPPASAPIQPSPPASAPKQTSVVTSSPQNNGVVPNTSILKSPEPKTAIKKSPEPKTAIQQNRYNLDKDLVEWMKGAFKWYITLAAQKPNIGRSWGYRMAQMAVGLDVMARGERGPKEVFPHFVDALFEMMDLSKSLLDLELLEYILKDAVYLDVLAEAAEFQTKNGNVSVNFYNCYHDKYTVFSAADELVKGRTST